MLIVRSYINYNEIDLLLIHNTGLTNKKGEHKYTISDNKRILKTVYHKRGDGHRELLLKTLLKLKEGENYDTEK